MLKDKQIEKNLLESCAEDKEVIVLNLQIIKEKVKNTVCERIDDTDKYYIEKGNLRNKLPVNV